MKSIIKPIAITLGLLILFPAFALSEIYKCGDTWSTKPCKEGALPVTGLPELSKVQRGSYEQDNPTNSSTKATSSESTEKKVYAPSCTPTAQGLDITLTGTRLHEVRTSDYVTITLKGTIRNLSSKYLSSPLYLQINKNSKSGEEQVKLLTDDLAPRSSMGFSKQIYNDKPNRPYPISYWLTLLYTPARHCNSSNVLTYSATQVKNSTSTNSPGFKEQLLSKSKRQTLKSLRNLEREVANLKRKFFNNSIREDTEFQWEKNRLLGRLRTVCSQARVYIKRGRSSNNAINQKCIAISHQLQKIK